MSERIIGRLNYKLDEVDFVLERLKNKKKLIDNNIRFLEELRRIVYTQVLSEKKIKHGGEQVG